jgi:predicted Zn-dependent protease
VRRYPLPVMPLPFARTACAVVLASTVGCAAQVNPVTGRRDVVLMTPEDELQVDEQATQEIATGIGLVSDPELTSYVEEVGTSLVAHSPRQDVEYHFEIVEMDEPNAFALPGGHIFVSRGLLLLANTQSELAHVLGHEIGHVAARHAATRDAHVKTLGLATLLGDLLSGGGADQPDAERVSGDPIARYARNQERQADTIGQQIATDAGVEPSGMARFLTALDNYTKLSQGFSMPQTYFATHPATHERMAEAAARAQAVVWQTGTDSALGGQSQSYLDARDAYLDRIDGMSVSRPASEGVFVEDRFLHADLGFSLRFPFGWTTHNEPARVMAISPKRDGVVLLELQGPGSDPVAAAREYAEREGLLLQRGTPVKIGSLPAFRAVSGLRTAFGPLNTEITWVAYDGRVYRLIGGVRGGDLRKYQGQFRKFAQSFRPLEPGEVESIEELRLRSAYALSGETLSQLSARTGNQWDLTYTAVANALFSQAPLPEGTRFKIAVLEPYQVAPVPPPEPVAVEEP